MDIELEHVAIYVESMVAEVGVYALAKVCGVSRQTIYNIMGGGWPSKSVADALKLRIVIPSKKIRSHMIHKSLKEKP
jgi:hypothetical protein